MSDNLLKSSPDEQKKAFFALKTPRDVARLLDYTYSRLVYQIHKNERYECFVIQKKSGGKRQISSPSRALKLIQRRLNQVLQNVYIPKPTVYGFVVGKNIVDNANKHKKKNWVLNIDLENFFPSINLGRVRGMFMNKPYNLPADVATFLANVCCFNNELPQGAPTSPIVSNMLCAQMDSQLQDLAWKNRCFYTRYADDITFSTTLRNFPPALAKVNSINDVELGSELLKIIQGNGFAINTKKVRAYAYFQRQEVTGLTVNKFPNVRRKYLMQIRAMLHAWDSKGLEAAESEHNNLYDNKHRHPDYKPPAFKKIIKGKIDYLGMVKGRENKKYLDFRREYLRLSRRDKNVPLKNISPKIESAIRIYTEGPTDALILKTAWKKLYEDEIPFKISAVEILPGIATGAGPLADELNTHRQEHGILIGIFDRDAEGIRAYKSLHSEFDEKDSFKIAINRMAAAFLLPIPAGKEILASLDKLWIENYFTETALSMKTDDNKGLRFNS